MNRGVALFACLAIVLLGYAGASSATGLKTAILDPDSFQGPQRDLAFSRTTAAGASRVRLLLVWRYVAPTTAPTDPANPLAYAQGAWAAFDDQVKAATAAGLEPIVYIQSAPDWAEGSGPGVEGTVRPDPVEFGAFAAAAAKRYSGLFLDPADPTGTTKLPRVRYWQAWNEPNRDYFLMPQYENGRVVSAGHYRQMVRRFGDAVHAVASEKSLTPNYVIAGGLAPLGRPGKPAPLAFMRKMLCMSLPPHRRTCDLRNAKIPFDVWAHHPYTSGGPTHQAFRRDDVSLGDLREMRRLLLAAAAAGQIEKRRPAFWVTEFSWDSNPPDPKALGARLHARWTSEALYRMWASGVSVVTWFRLFDDPLSESPYQSGFFLEDKATRKLSLQAFRFPVVALRRPGRIFVWGRTPSSSAGTVVIQVRPAGASTWRRLGTLTTNGWGIFRRTYRSPYTKGYVRAQLPLPNGETSRPFSLTYVKDRYVNPFGCGGTIRC